MTQPDEEASMRELFGEESDHEDDAQQTQQQPTSPSTPQAPAPAAAAAVNSDIKELFGSDDEDAEGGQEEEGEAPLSPGPYRSDAISDLEQQLAGFQEDETAAEEPATQDGDDRQRAEDEGRAVDESQERKREKALAKRKKLMGREDGQERQEGADAYSSPSLPEEDDDARHKRDKRSSTASPPPSKPPAVITASGPAITLAAPPVPPFPASASLHLVRLPNVIGVAVAPFSADTYVEEVVGEQQEEEAVGQRGGQDRKDKKKAVSLMIENVMRWREVADEDGKLRRESNARWVRWSDGTSSLLIGNECFDILSTQQDAHRNYLFLSQDGHRLGAEDDDDMRDDDNEHRSQPQPFLTSVGAFVGHVKLKVTGIDSESHRKLKDVLFETHTRKARIVMDFTEMNPEKRRQEEEKQERKKEALERRRKAKAERAGGGRVKTGWGGRSGLEVDFLEEGDEEELHAGDRRRGDDEEPGDVRRLNRLKEEDDEDEDDDGDVIAAEDDEEGEQGEDGEDDEEELAQLVGGKRRAEEPDTPGAEGEASGTTAPASAEATGTGAARRADEVDEDLVLQRHGSSKKRRVLADDEESE